METSHQIAEFFRNYVNRAVVGWYLVRAAGYFLAGAGGALWMNYQISTLTKEYIVASMNANLAGDLSTRTDLTNISNKIDTVSVKLQENIEKIRIELKSDIKEVDKTDRVGTSGNVDIEDTVQDLKSIVSDMRLGERMDQSDRKYSQQLLIFEPLFPPENGSNLNFVLVGSSENVPQMRSKHPNSAIAVSQFQ